MKSEKNIFLMDFLLEKTEYSKSKIKSLIKYRKIKVNGNIVDGDIILKPNDIVKILKLKKVDDNVLNILYEDKDLIVVNKESGLLTIATTKEHEKTLYNLVRKYVKSKHKNNQIFIVHRLDKDTAGIVVFAKNEKVKYIFQNNWNELVKKRGYVAVCEGIFEKENGTIRNYLKENKNTYVHITNSKDGKLAITNYKVIKSNHKYSLIELNIETGRKNQIRVHMKSINHPIVGDSKYGNKSIEKLCLIANELVFVHPITHKEMNFKLDIPDNFKKLVKS